MEGCGRICGFRLVMTTWFVFGMENTFWGLYFPGISGNHYFAFAVLSAVAACVAFAASIAFVVSAACVGN